MSPYDSETLVLRAHLITIHGRTKEMGQRAGNVNWSQISTVIEALDGSVPALANGGIEVFETWRATSETGACGAMTSETLSRTESVFDGS